MEKPVRWITRRQKLEALGLFVLGNKYTKQADAVIKELAKTLGEKEAYGHCGDAIYGSRTFEELLKIINIKVKR